MNLGKAYKSIYFVGVGGIGMSALALVLKSMGYWVSGSDSKQSTITDMLQEKDINVSIGDNAIIPDNIDLLVYSSAVPTTHPHRLFAKENNIPEMRRAELLGGIFLTHKSRLAIAGTHGKTTTTAMVGHIFERNGMKPTVLVGGILQNSKLNGIYEKGDVCIVEADEYDRSFLALSPTGSIVTTLDEDHLDIYKDLNDIKATFISFLEKTPSSGLNILCNDAPNIRDILPNLTKPYVLYGFNNEADFHVSINEIIEGKTYFSIKHENDVYNLTLQLPGEHNVLNAAAAFIISLHNGIDAIGAISALSNFSGVERRFEFIGEAGNIKIYDDYAHHPAEVTATLSAVKSVFPHRRIVVIFQPHLYSRTRDFANEFAEALSMAHFVLLADIYPAREKAIEGVSSQMIYAKITSAKLSLGPIYNAESVIFDALQPNDIVLTMGAGDVWKMGRQLLTRIAAN